MSKANKAMTEQAREARRAYRRAWAAANKDKVQAAQIRYWERKAAQQNHADEQQETKQN